MGAGVGPTLPGRLYALTGRAPAPKCESLMGLDGIRVLVPARDIYASLVKGLTVVNIRVRREEGWTIVTFDDDVERISVGFAPSEGGHTITLAGVREDAPNQVETRILDVDPQDEGKLNSAVPRQDGVALPLVKRDEAN